MTNVHTLQSDSKTHVHTLQQFDNLAFVMWKNQYSHFRSHSIHIVKNYSNPNLAFFFEKNVKLL